MPLFNGAEAHDVPPEPALDDLFQAHKRAAADKQNVGRINADVFLLGMFAAALRRNIADSAFQDFQKRLLHAFAGDIARDGRAV